MNDQVFKQKFCGELSGIAFTTAQKKAMICHLSGMKTAKTRLKPAIALMFCIILFVTSALAWVLYPTLSAWFSGRSTSVSISPDFLVQPLPETPLAKINLKDIQIAIWEAYTDKYTFMVNAEFASEEDADNIVIKPYSGLLSELPETDSDTTIRFVSIESWYGDANNEVFMATASTNNDLWILNEGWLGRPDNEVFLCRLTVASYVHGEIEVEQTEVTVLARQMEVIDKCSLSDTLVFPKTQFEVCSLEFVQTELRCYYSYEGTGAHQPLSHAIRDLGIIIVDENGKRIPDRLPYGRPIPNELYVQVVDDKSGEIVEIQKVIRKGEAFVCE